MRRARRRLLAAAERERSASRRRSSRARRSSRRGTACTQLDLLLPHVGAGVQMFVLDPLVGEFRLRPERQAAVARVDLLAQRGQPRLVGRARASTSRRSRTAAARRQAVLVAVSARWSATSPRCSTAASSATADAKNWTASCGCCTGGADGVPGRTGGRPRAHGEDARDGPAAALGAAGARAARLARRRARVRSFYEASTDPELAERCLSRLEPGQPLDTVMDTLPDSVALDTTGDGRVDTIKRLVNERTVHS